MVRNCLKRNLRDEINNPFKISCLIFKYRTDILRLITPSPLSHVCNAPVVSDAAVDLAVAGIHGVSAISFVYAAVSIPAVAGIPTVAGVPSVASVPAGAGYCIL
jgi:hypothetical protein